MDSNEDPFEIDPLTDIHGVLLSDTITFYVENKEINLITNFEKENLKPASYKLRLGDEYYTNGKYHHLSEDQPDLEIPPFSIVVISTYEELNIPRYLIGRWNLKIDLVYKGLLWSGAAQVDPGYKGKLFCPLHNLSKDPVILKYKEPVVTIDFVKTTPFNPTKSKTYLQKRPGKRISELIKSKLRSGPQDTLEKVDRIEKRVNDLLRLLPAILAGVIASLGIIVAILAYTLGANAHILPPLYTPPETIVTPPPTINPTINATH